MATSSKVRPLVLLVEDDVHAARGLARMLADDGFDVERAVDGADAIARLSHNPLPDALITDFYMPHADGLTVARFARGRNPNISTIVVTGHAELIARGSESMATVFVKPLDYDALIQTLRTLLKAAA
jgi:two-component system response regulator MprA